MDEKGLIIGDFCFMLIIVEIWNIRNYFLEKNYR